MAKASPKKKHPKFQRNASVRAKGKKKSLPAVNPRSLRNRGWMVAGFDTSMSSIAGAAIGYDHTLKKLRGPEFVMVRWSKEDHYFDRLKVAAKAHEILLDLQHQLALELNMSEVWIAQEEPIPLGMIGKGAGSFLKQQAEISGAFLGGLLRYGYTNVSQMNSIRWRTLVAQDLEITTHVSKWRSDELAAKYNCTLNDSGKFRAKQWAINPGYAFMGGAFPEEIPVWEDIIESGKLGKVPRPEGSTARAKQPDDRYDALAVMWTHYGELLDEGIDL